MDEVDRKLEKKCTAMKLPGIEQARKLQATLVRNYDRVTYSLTGVKCRATSVAKDTFAGEPDVPLISR